MEYLSTNLSKPLFKYLHIYICNNTQYRYMSNSVDYLKAKMESKIESTPKPTETAPTQNVVEPNNEVVSDAVNEPTNDAVNVQSDVPKVEDEQPKVVESNKESEVIKETLPEKKYANEQVAELNNFLERNPEKSLDDYQRLKRPTNSLSEDELLKEFLSVKEGKTTSEIALEMKKMEVEEGDDDFGDDNESLEAKAKRERTLLEASKWREEYQQGLFTAETPSTPQNEGEKLMSYETVYNQLLDEGQKRQETVKQDYYTKTYQALSEINDISVSVYGEEVRLAVDDSMKKVIREGLDVEKSLGKFYDENGLIKDPKGYIEKLAWWDDASREILLAKRDEQVEARVRADLAKNRKNITLNNVVPMSGNTATDATKEKVDAYFTKKYKQF